MSEEKNTPEVKKVEFKDPNAHLNKINGDDQKPKQKNLRDMNEQELYEYQINSNPVYRKEHEEKIAKDTEYKAKFETTTKIGNLPVEESEEDLSREKITEEEGK